MTQLNSFPQMTDHSEAQRAINEQGVLNRVGTEIYVNFRWSLAGSGDCI